MSGVSENWRIYEIKGRFDESNPKEHGSIRIRGERRMSVIGGMFTFYVTVIKNPKLLSTRGGEQDFLVAYGFDAKEAQEDEKKDSEDLEDWVERSYPFIQFNIVTEFMESVDSNEEDEDETPIDFAYQDYGIPAVIYQSIFGAVMADL